MGTRYLCRCVDGCPPETVPPAPPHAPIGHLQGHNQIVAVWMYVHRTGISRRLSRVARHGRVIQCIALLDAQLRI